MALPLMRCPPVFFGGRELREVSTREAGRRYRLNGSRRYGHGGVATFSEDIVRATCIFRSARRIFLTPAQMQKRLKKDMMRERRKAFRIVLMLANERDMRPRLCFHLMPSSQTARIFWRRRSAFAVCRHVVVRPATNKVAENKKSHVPWRHVRQQRMHRDRRLCSPPGVSDDCSCLPRTQRKKRYIRSKDFVACACANLNSASVVVACRRSAAKSVMTAT